MPSVLIVNDDLQISRKMAQCIKKSSPQADFDIEQASYSNLAKKFLRENSYQILLIDIALPSTTDGDVILNEGIRLLEWILDPNCGCNVPECIIGVTFNQDVTDEAMAFFQNNVNLFISASSCEDFYASLAQRINQYVRSSYNAKRNKKFNAYCAVTCALEEEYQILLKNGWNWERYVGFNEVTYHIAYVQSKGEERKIIAVLSPQMGMLDAAIVNMQIIHEFNPEYLSMTGICAAVTSSLNYGDIIIAETSWDWSIGKWVTIDGVPQMLNEPYQISIAQSLKIKFRSLIGDKALLNSIYESCPYQKPATVLKAYMGPLASGPSVISSSVKKGLIMQQHRKLLGIDMESFSIFGVGDKIPSGAEGQRKFFVIKSVVDHADESKNDNFHAYAAYTSAMFFTHVVENL